MKDNLKCVRFFECLIPVTICNLKCSYCYVIQRNYRNMKKANMLYSPEHMGQCLTQERLGGPCYFSICGAGETMAQPEIIEIVENILKRGHFVNITTNGTLTVVFKKLTKLPKEFLTRLHFSFSFHYLELKRLNLLDKFFENIHFVKDLGCSFMVQLNLCDEYLAYLDEIKSNCIEKIGAMPQLAATRKESEGLVNVELHTKLSQRDYEEIGETFDSPLFKYTMKNFNVRRKEFCYAGDRSGVLNLATGELKKCYGDPCSQKIFEDPNKKINFSPVGKNCYSSFCMNSSHFMSLGILNNEEKDTYCSLRNREEVHWFNDTMKEVLSNKMVGNNIKYNGLQKAWIECKEKNKKIYLIGKKVAKRVLRKDKKCQEPKN